MNRRPPENKKIAALGLFLLLIPLIPAAAYGQDVQSQEARAEEFLSQGDGYYLRGEYQRAIDQYLAAAGLAQQKMNLSRAYFGLSLSYYYLRDTSSTRTWLKKVFEADPQKEISSLFYPEGFVQLFNDLKKELAGAPPAVAEKQEAAPPRDITREVRTEPKLKAQEPPAASQTRLEGIMPPEERRGGYWEVDVHYGSWGLNAIKSLFEKSINKRLGSEIRNELTEHLSASHVALVKSGYEQNLAFDSGGSNYGLEVRYYPLGRNGTFSVGFALEKTKIRFDVAGAVKQFYDNGSSAKIDASSYVETSPFTTNVNFRWDFARSWPVVPYFVVGFGFGSMSGTFSFKYTGTFEYSGMSESVSDEQKKTLEELGTENSNHLSLNFFVLVQTMFGVKAEIFKGLTLKVETGIWDGLVFRGALAFRF